MLRSVMEHWKWAGCLWRREGGFALRRIQISLLAPDLKARRKERNAFQLVMGADEEGGMGIGQGRWWDWGWKWEFFGGAQSRGSLTMSEGVVWVGEGGGEGGANVCER